MITNQKKFNEIKKDIIDNKLSTNSIIDKYANKNFSNTDEIIKTVQYISWNYFKDTGINLNKIRN